MNYTGNLVFQSTSMGWAYSSDGKDKKSLLNFVGEFSWETST
jgi:hypothetical protein